MFRSAVLAIVLLLLTGCTAKNDGLDALAKTSCAAITGSYNSWELVASKKDTSSTSAVAEQNFEETLDFIFKSTLEVVAYDDLLRANDPAESKDSDFSGLEKLAGIERFRFQLDNLQNLEKPNKLRWTPGSHVTIDGWFENLVVKRCAPREKAPIAENLETWPLDGYELYSTDLAYRTVEHSIDCGDCGGLTYEFVAKTGCEKLEVFADFVEPNGNVRDSKSQSFSAVPPLTPIMVEIWTLDKTPDLGISFRSVRCR